MSREKELETMPSFQRSPLILSAVYFWNTFEEMNKDIITVMRCNNTSIMKTLMKIKFEEKFELAEGVTSASQQQTYSFFKSKPANKLN